MLDDILNAGASPDRSHVKPTVPKVPVFSVLKAYVHK